jgi:hypothetical protein
MAGPAPETVRGKGRKPDHLEIGILESDAHVIGPHAETHADAAIDLDPMGQFALGDQAIDMLLRQVSGGRADIPVIFEGDGAHAAFGCLDRDLHHVLGTVNEIGKGMDMTVNGAL